MCLTCGCLRPDSAHGNPRNLTLTHLAAAARAGGVTITEAAWNIPRTLTAATTPGWPPGPAEQTPRPTLLWDMDGILAFTAETMCTLLNTRFATSFQPQSQGFFTGLIKPGALPPEMEAWLHTQMADPLVLRTIAPDFHAGDTLTAAVAAGWDCHVVTEREPLAAAATCSWLAAWDLPPIPVTAVGWGSKPGWVRTRYGPTHPAVLIDDNPLVRVTIAGDGLDVWQPTRPYVPPPARAHVRVFGSWAEARWWLGIAPPP